MNGKNALETALADLVQKSFARRKLDAKIKEAQSLAAAESHETGNLDNPRDALEDFGDEE